MFQKKNRLTRLTSQSIATLKSPTCQTCQTCCGKHGKHGMLDSKRPWLPWLESGVPCNFEPRAPRAPRPPTGNRSKVTRVVISLSPRVLYSDPASHTSHISQNVKIRQASCRIMQNHAESWDVPKWSSSDNGFVASLLCRAFEQSRQGLIQKLSHVRPWHSRHSHDGYLVYSLEENIGTLGTFENCLSEAF